MMRDVGLGNSADWLHQSAPSLSTKVKRGCVCVVSSRAAYQNA